MMSWGQVIPLEMLVLIYQNTRRQILEVSCNLHTFMILLVELAMTNLNFQFNSIA